MTLINVVATVVAKKDSVQKVKELMESLVEPTRAEKGCIQYDLLQDNVKEEIFVFVEQWASIEDLDAHKATPRFNDVVKQLGPVHESLDIKLLHKVK